MQFHEFLGQCLRLCCIQWGTGSGARHRQCVVWFVSLALSPLSLSDSQPVHQLDVTREQAFAVNGSEGSSARVVNAQN